MPVIRFTGQAMTATRKLAPEIPAIGRIDSSMGNVKCTSFINLKNHWRSLGPGTEEKLLETLSPELQDLHRNLAPDQWCSIERSLEMDEALGKFLFPQETETVRLCKLGSLMANLDMDGLTKLILKFTNVPYAVQQATVIWHTYHDQGETFVEQPGKNHLRFLIFDYPAMPSKYRFLLAGWIRGLLEICGAKHPVVTLQQSTPHIAYDIHWN
jgi:hypothetical protein